MKIKIFFKSIKKKILQIHVTYNKFFEFTNNKINLIDLTVLP